MAQYAYVMHDLMTGAVVGEVELRGVEYELGVNAAGSASGTLTLAGIPEQQRRDLLDATTPRQRVLHIERDGVLVWGGIVWGRRRQLGGGVAELSCKEYLSYYDHVLITDDLSLTNLDQAAMIRVLVQYAHDKAGSDIGVIPRAPAYLSGTYRTREYQRSETKSVGDALRELANASWGCDVRMAPELLGGTLMRFLYIGTPSLGRPQSQTGFVLDGHEFSYDEDGESSANNVWVVGSVPEGSPEGTPTPMETASDSLFMIQGVPRLERAWSMSTVSSAAVLREHARSRLAVYRNIQVSCELTRLASAHPGVGTLLPGDEVRVLGQGTEFPEGVDELMTATSVKIKVEDNGTDTLSLSLVPPTVEEDEA